MDANEQLPIRLRQAVADDANFILNSWLKSYKSSFFAKNIANEIYFTEHHKLIERLLKECKTIVACNKDDPTQIYGYINGGYVEGFLVINYLYVKQSFRGLGIGKSLINVFEHSVESAAICSHSTKVMEKISSRYNIIYHPYILFKEFDKMESENE